MIKASFVGTDGRRHLLIGLSFGNLDRFRAQPGNTYITIDGWEFGLAVDVLIFSGETEERCAEAIQALIGPNTKVTITRV